MASSPKRTVMAQNYRASLDEEGNYRVMVEELVKPKASIRCSVKLTSGRLCMNKVGCLLHIGLPPASLEELSVICPHPRCRKPKLICPVWEHSLPKSLIPLVNPSPPSFSSGLYFFSVPFSSSSLLALVSCSFLFVVQVTPDARKLPETLACV